MTGSPDLKSDSASPSRDVMTSTATSPSVISTSLDEIEIQDLTYARELGLVGHVTGTASVTDPRFMYFLYIPESYVESSDPLKLLVLVHGSGRHTETLMDSFVSFANENGVALLTPVFPAGIYDPNDNDNYKFILYRDIRFDNVLLDIIGQVHQRYPKITVDTFSLFGFSGGGQFVHRFMYLHPERLGAVSIGAPGTITLLDGQQDWPIGIRNIDEVFPDIPSVNIDALKSLPIHLVVGSSDTSVLHHVARKRVPLLTPDLPTRLDYVDRLEASFKSIGVSPSKAIVAGAAHETNKMAPAVIEFLLSA